MSIDQLKIAIVHDWILNLGGAERVLKVLHEMFPDAPIYTLFYNKNFTDSFLPEADIRPTFLQKTRRWIKKHKLLLPLVPFAVESIDLSDFDLVISSSVAFSKGLILKTKTTHICYCYSPTRFLWDWHSEYARSEKLKIRNWGVRILQHILRIWDGQSANRVDYFVAISKNVQERIRKYYRKNSTVIYPPVERREGAVKIYEKSGEAAEFYLIISRLFAHKNIDIAIEAFNKLGYPLVIIGDGPNKKNLKKISKKNITFLGELSDKDTSQYYGKCKAFIMPQEEDFGITPIEAMIYGKPVLALRRGGATEYIMENINGEFFDDPTPEVLADGIRRLNENYKNYSPLVIKKTAERFSRQRFENEITSFIKRLPEFKS